MNDYRVTPATVRWAMAWVAAVHRHLPEIQGGLFAVCVEYRGTPVGVGIAANPPPAWQGKPTIVIARVAVLPDLPSVGDHAAPACSMIYGALCRAATALGYADVWSYTLPGEDGRSLKAAGFVFKGMTRGGELSRPSRPRAPVICAEPKGRWYRNLS